MVQSSRLTNGGSRAWAPVCWFTIKPMEAVACFPLISYVRRSEFSADRKLAKKPNLAPRAAAGVSFRSGRYNRRRARRSKMHVPVWPKNTYALLWLSVNHHRGQTAVSGYEARKRRLGKVAPRMPGLGFVSDIG
jgi:hypothetical protein